jgi:hypothetical protein
MKKEIADKWIEALRSGEYKQGTGTLQNKCGYCCLGVLCKLAEREGVPVAHDLDNFLRTGYLKGNMLDTQESVKYWANLHSNDGSINSDLSLARENDKWVDFNEIADMIEKYWEIL